MTKKMVRKSVNSILAFLMVFSLLLPLNAFADSGKSSAGLSSEARAQIEQLVGRQLIGSDEAPFLDPSLKGLSGDEEVAVIVELTQPSVALEKGISALQGKSFSATAEKTAVQKAVSQQEKFTNALDSKGIDVNVELTYTSVLNALSVTLKASQVEKLAKVDGVKGIYPVVEYQAEPIQEAKPLMNVSGPFIGAPQVWNLGYEGEGIKVGVIDTGIDYEHPDLKDVYKGGWNFVQQPVNGSPSNGYARPRAENDPYETTPEDRPDNRPAVNASGDSFETSHGTHVSGTIAAQGENPYGVKGIAPKVELHAYRVLGAYGSGSSSWVIGGINKAVEEKMDVINLSLGAKNNDPDYITSIAINNAMLSGTIAVVSNGNSGPNRGTVGSPGTAAFAISVGNTTVPEEIKSADVSFAVYANEDVTSVVYSTTLNANLMTYKFGQDPAEALPGEYTVVPVPGNGEPADYEGLDVTGKIALISRGGFAFVTKIINAKEAGAVGVIIHNSETGTGAPGPFGGFLGVSFEYLPTFDLSYTDGVKWREELEKGTGKVTFSNFGGVLTLGDEMASSSSRGPVSRTLDIKPDVSAPGTNIMSTWPAYGKDYSDADYTEAFNAISGTSMAAPHVAGVAALVKEKLLESGNYTSPFDVKVALMNTAKVLDTSKYDVFDQGAGRVQALEAINTQALAKVLDTTSYTENDSVVTHENITGSLNFGRTFLDPAKTQTLTKTIRVENLTDGSSSYAVNINQTRTFGNTSLAVDKTSFVLGANSEELTVTLTIPAGAATAQGEYQGYITISNGTTKLSLPYVAYFGNVGLAGFKSNLSIDRLHLSDAEGFNSTNVGYSFYNQQKTTNVLLWSATEPGPKGDGYIGYISGGNGLSADKLYSAPWDLSYRDLATLEKAVAKDGVYTIDVQSQDVAGTVQTKWTKPVFVKRTPAEIVAPSGVTVTDSTYFQASIKDSYFDLIKVAEENSEEKYDINDLVKVSYQLTNSNGVVVSTGETKLSAEGNFEVYLSGVTTGSNKLTLFVDDVAGNRAEKEVVVSVAGTSIVLPPTTGTNPTGEVSVTEKKNEDGTTSATSVVPSSVISNQLSGTATSVKVDLAKVTFASYKDVTVSVDKSTTDKLVESGKDLVLSGEGFTVSIPAKALADFIDKDGFAIILSVNDKDAGKDATIKANVKSSVASAVVTVSSKTNKLSHAIEIAVKSVSKAVTDSRKVGVYQKAADGAWTFVGSKQKDGVFTVNASSLGSYAAIQYNPTFADITKHWAKDEIEVVAALHVTNGTSATTFSPNAAVTRAEFATLLDRILGEGNTWASHAKEPGAKDKITREEMVVMVAKALNVQSSGKGLSFADDKQISSNAKDAVAFATENGIINGVGDNRFAPKETFTRSQAAVIIYRLLNYLNN